MAGEIQHSRTLGVGGADLFPGDVVGTAFPANISRGLGECIVSEGISAGARPRRVTSADAGMVPGHCGSCEHLGSGRFVEAAANRPTASRHWRECRSRRCRDAAGVIPDKA